MQRTHCGSITPNIYCRMNAISIEEALTPNPSSIKLKQGPRRKVPKLHQCHHQVHPTRKIPSQLLALAVHLWMATTTVILPVLVKNTILKGHLPRVIHQVLIQVTKVREAISIPTNTTEAQSTTNNILQEAISPVIGPCTLLMAPRVTGDIISHLVAPREDLLVLQGRIRTTATNLQAINRGQAIHRLHLPVQELLSHLVNLVIITDQTSLDGILTLPRISNLINPLANKGLPCMVAGQITPNTEVNIHRKEVHNRTPSNGINLQDLVLHLVVKLARASGLKHLTNLLRILSSRGDRTCLLQE